MVQTSGLNKIVIIAGPTASGKTCLSLKCAKKLCGEIIGCDSMQIYKELDIGTGKISKDERSNIPHFMIDIIPPQCEFSVNSYVSMCDKIITDICLRKKNPIIVGGTGLYIGGLLKGLDYAGAVKSDTIRKKYIDLSEKYGKEYLFDILKKIDPEASTKINVNDTKRIIRAIEIFELTGKTKTEAATKNSNERYNYKLVVLSPSREKLYRDINTRVDNMMSAGLVDEAKKLYLYKECQSMQAIGYKEIFAYIEGKITLEEATELIKINTRHYAKRQLTYFKNMDFNKVIIDDYSPEKDDSIIDELIKFIEG